MIHLAGQDETAPRDVQFWMVLIPLLTADAIVCLRAATDGGLPQARPCEESEKQVKINWRNVYKDGKSSRLTLVSMGASRLPNHPGTTSSSPSTSAHLQNHSTAVSNRKCGHIQLLRPSLTHTQMPKLTHWPIRRAPKQEYCTAKDGTEFQRTVKWNGKRTEWKPVPPPKDGRKGPPAYLTLVRQRLSQSAPLHWCLLVAPGGGPGDVYQVRGGDPTFMPLVFVQSKGISSFDDYHDSFTLARLNDEQEYGIWRASGFHVPLYTSFGEALTENSQDWAIQFLEDLRDDGIVSEERLEFVMGLKETTQDTES